VTWLIASGLLELTHSCWCCTMVLLLCYAMVLLCYAMVLLLCYAMELLCCAMALL
jgi:hypothetical protein